MIHKTATRRAFLREAMRYPILAALAILAGTLLRRRSGLKAACGEVISCRECRAFGNCAMPGANSARTLRNP